MALAGLATQLPVPVEVARSLVGRGAAGGTGGPSGAAALDAAALTVAAAVVWLMLGWACVICGTAALATVPGVAGRFGRATLRRIAPVAIRRVVIAGMGVSVFAGAAACAVQQPVGTSQPAATSAALTSKAALTSSAALTSTRPHPAIGPASGDLGAGGEASGDLGAGGRARPGTGDRGVPFPAGAAESLDQDWPVQRPGSSPDVDVDWPGPPASTPHASTAPPAKPEASTPLAATPRATAPHTATAHPGVPRRPAAPKHAAPQSAAPQSAAPHPAASPSAVPHPAAPRSAAPQPGSPRIVIVHPGDSLWKLAALDLGPGADDAHIDAAWRSWYAANRALIGGDPDLIQPGQRLQPPDQSHHTSEN